MLTWEVMLREVCNFLDPAPLQNNTEALIYFTSFPSPQESTQTFEDEEENEEDDEDKDGAKDDDDDDAGSTVVYSFWKGLPAVMLLCKSLILTSNSQQYPEKV